MRDKLSPWVAAMFCAFLSLITIVGDLFLAFANGSSGTGIDYVFYANLPMCFYFVGAVVSDLRKENLVLRTRIDQLTTESAVKG